MNKVVKIGSTLRNHWKKSIFFSCAAAYGANWYIKKQQDTALLTRCCREALNYGTITQGVNQPNYHVTVILNPAASGGNGRKLFEQYSAPLLHLAGLKVSLQKTEGREEAKDLMKIMENTDAVLVAGGDGTLMEAITGLMRRDDADAFCRNVPIGVIPVGENNTLASRLFPCSDQVEQMTRATMAVIKQLKKPMGVIQVENLSEDENYKGRRIYAFNSLEMGAWREAYIRKDNLWLIFQALKKRMTFVFSYLTGHKEVNWEWPSHLSFTTTETITRQVEEKPRGMAAIFSKPTIVEKTEDVETWSDESEVTPSQIEIKTDEKNQCLQEKIFSADFTFSDFVTDGWRRLNKEDSSLNPEILSAKQFKIDTQTDIESPRLMSVDGEEVELVGPIKVSLIPDMVHVFCAEEEAVEPQESKSKGPAAMWSSVPVSSYMANASKQNLRI